MTAGTGGDLLDPTLVEEALQSLTRRFGAGVLRDPGRMRNLLIDEYGARGMSNRADIELVVSSLEGRPLEALESGIASFDVSVSIATKTGLPADRARWLVSTMASAAQLGVTDPPSNPSGSVPVPTDLAPGPSDAFVVDQSGDAPGEGRRSWLMLGIVALVAVLGGFAGWVIGNAGASDADAPTSVLTRTESSGEGRASEGASATSGDVEWLEAELDSVRGELAQAEDQLVDSAELLGDLTSQVGSLEAQLGEAQGAAQDAEDRAEAAQNRVAAAEDQATTAERRAEAAEAMAAPFNANAIRHPLGRLPGTAQLVWCDGFTSCSDEIVFDLRIVDEGGQRYFEALDVAKVPIDTFDEVSWSGYGEVIGGGYSTCAGSPLPTDIWVSMVPIEFTVDPSNKSLAARSYLVYVDFSTPAAGGCNEASRSYEGTFTFS